MRKWWLAAVPAICLLAGCGAVDAVGGVVGGAASAAGSVVGATVDVVTSPVR